MAEVELPNPEELEEIQKKAFTRRVALVTAVFAVILALASLGGNNAGKEVLLTQQQSSDQWAFYQAKVIREHLYGNQKTLLMSQFLGREGRMTHSAQSQYETMLKKAEEEENRYREEKKEIETEAKKLEQERDLYRSKLPYFEYAEVLLQISIVMASISILASSGFLFSIALSFAVLGTALTVNGFFLMFRIPFMQ